MLDNFTKGEKKIKTMLGIFLGIDALTILLMLLSANFPSAFKGIIRALITYWLFMNILKGKNWARITISVLSILGGISGIIMTITSGYIITLIIGAAFLSIGIILLKSPDIKGYMKYKKEESLLRREII